MGNKKTMMTISYAIMANMECHNFIRKTQLELHQRVGSELARQSPHITNKSPFNTAKIEDHILYLESLSNKMRSFQIELKGFGSFGDKVIFMAVKDNKNLTELHKTVLRDLKDRFNLTPHEFEGENIKFHMSIAGFEDLESFNKAQQYLRRYNPEFKYKIRTLGLFYYLGSGNGWIVNRKFGISSQI